MQRETNLPLVQCWELCFNAVVTAAIDRSCASLTIQDIGACVIALHSQAVTKTKTCFNITIFCYAQTILFVLLCFIESGLLHQTGFIS